VGDWLSVTRIGCARFSPFVSPCVETLGCVPRRNAVAVADDIVMVEGPVGAERDNTSGTLLGQAVIRRPSDLRNQVSIWLSLHLPLVATVAVGLFLVLLAVRVAALVSRTRTNR
jgi:hypothetical protein